MGVTHVSEIFPMPGGKKVCVANQQKSLILQCCDVVRDVLRIGCAFSDSPPRRRAVPGGRPELFPKGLRQQSQAGHPIRTLPLIAYGRDISFVCPIPLGVAPGRHGVLGQRPWHDLARERRCDLPVLTVGLEAF